MLKNLNDLFGRLRPFARNAKLVETKQSSVSALIALHTAKAPVWTPRNYTDLVREGFTKNAIAYRCIRMINEAAASIPLRVEYLGKHIADHPLQKLIDNPNIEQGGADLREAMYGGLQTAGNAYIEAVFNDDDTPFELWALRPDRVKVVPSSKGWPESYEYSVNGQKSRIGRDTLGWLKVLHLKLYNPLDDWYGLSPLEAAGFAIDVHNSSAVWNKSLLDNAARPSGALIYGSKGSERLSEDQFNRLKDQLSTTYSGSENAGRPLLLEGGLDWKPMSMSPADMDFTQGKYAAAREIALCFGVPAQLLGIPGDNAYANFKEANSAFWRHTILPLAEKTTRSLSQWLEPKFIGAKIILDLDAVTSLSAERESLWARLEAATFLTNAERRRLAGLSPIVEGDAP